MTINDEAGVLPWQQVVAQVRHLISSGEWPPGTKLPNARELGARFGVGPNTISKANAQLRAEGLIRTHRQQGSYVEQAPQMTRLVTSRYARSGRSPNRLEAEAAGVTLSTVGECSVTKANQRIAERLHVSVDDEVSRVDYFWLADGAPIQLSTQWEPLTLTRGTSAEVPPTSGHPDVITRFGAIGLHVDCVTEQTGARLPSPAEAARLDTVPASAVLEIARTHWAGKTPVETANIVLRADRVNLAATHHVEEAG